MAYSDRHVADHVIELSPEDDQAWREELEGVEGALLVHGLLSSWSARLTAYAGLTLTPRERFTST